MKEIWKNIKDYEGRYQVSNLGKIKSLKRKVNSKGGERELKEKILKNQLDKDGYYLIILSKKSKLKTCKVHRLVAKHFINNIDNKECINHKNGIKIDNNINNLEWVTRSENELHAYKTKLKIGTNRILNEKQVKEIKKLNMTHSEIGKIYNVSRRTIGDIKNNKTWRNI